MADFEQIMDAWLSDKEALATAGKAAGNYIADNAGAADRIFSKTLQ